VSVGHVILGSVEGNRIWARDLRSTQLTHLEVNIIIRPLYSVSQQCGVWYRSLGDVSGLTSRIKGALLCLF